MEANLCIVAVGAMQSSSLYADSGLEGWLDEKGMIKVRHQHFFLGIIGSPESVLISLIPHPHRFHATFRGGHPSSFSSMRNVQSRGGRKCAGPGS